MKLAEITASEFENFAKKTSCSNFLQSVEMKKRYDADKKENYLFGVKDDKKLLAVALVVTTRQKLGLKIFKCPGGPLLDYDAKDAIKILRFFSREMRQILNEKQGLVFEISPNIVSQPRDNNNNIIDGVNHLNIKRELIDAGYKYLGEYEQIKWSYLLPLKGKSADDLFMNFRTSHRRCVRRAQREGVRLRELKESELKILKRIVAESGDYHGFQDPTVQYYQSMKKAFGDKVKFIVSEAQIEGHWTPLTAAMFVDDGREMIYLYGGSVRKLQKLGGAHFMQWQMIQEALKKNYQVYNFYGVCPVDGNGVYFYKQGFGGHVEELLGTFMLPLNLKGRIYTLKQKYHEFGEVH